MLRLRRGHGLPEEDGLLDGGLHGDGARGSGAAVTLRLHDPAGHGDTGQAIGWRHGAVLGIHAHGLFKSPAVPQALFGSTVPTLDTAFDTLADLMDEPLRAPLHQPLWAQLLGLGTARA